MYPSIKVCSCYIEKLFFKKKIFRFLEQGPKISFQEPWNLGYTTVSQNLLPWGFVCTLLWPPHLPSGFWLLASVCQSYVCLSRGAFPWHWALLEFAEPLDVVFLHARCSVGFSFRSTLFSPTLLDRLKNPTPFSSPMFPALPYTHPFHVCVTVQPITSVLPLLMWWKPPWEKQF